MISVRPYVYSDSVEWDKFCARSLQATFLHTREFLSYHDNRFEDRSLVIEDNGSLIGLFPAALDLSNQKHVISHPGLTYGGLISGLNLSGKSVCEVIREVVSHYRDEGITKLTYKPVPYFYHRAPAQDDLYALDQIGFTRTRADLSSLIDLSSPRIVSDRRRRGLKKGKAAGIEIVTGMNLIDQFWIVLTDNLLIKHGATPTHSIEEIKYLAERFRENIMLIGAIAETELVAGTIIFTSHCAHHAQYIASTENGRRLGALDVVFDFAITKAREDLMRWFDFGISTSGRNADLNEGLHAFKSEFGGGGVCYDQYRIDTING